MQQNQQKQIMQPVSQREQLQINRVGQQNDGNIKKEKSAKQNQDPQNQNDYNSIKLACISTGIIFILLIVIYILYLLIGYFCRWFQICGVNWKPIIIILFFVLQIIVLKYIRVQCFKKLSITNKQEFIASLIQIFICLFVSFAILQVNNQGIYGFGLRNKYNICHSVIEVGSSMHQISYNNQTIINQALISKIIYRKWITMFEKKLLKFYVYHGTMGIGKTTAFKQTINKFINKNKLQNNFYQQKLFFYIDYQEIDTQKSFKQQSIKNIIGSMSKSFVFNQNQVQKLLFPKKLSSTRQFFIQTIKEVRKFYQIVIILDEFNGVKQKSAAIKFLTDLVRALKTKTQLKHMYLIIISSEIGLDSYLNSLNSNLRYKYQITKIFQKTSKTQLTKLFNLQTKKILALIKNENKKLKLKQMFKIKRSEIVQISYGFEQLKNLIYIFEDLYLNKQYQFQTFEVLIQYTFSQLRMEIKNIDQVHFCRICEQKQALLEKEQLQHLQKINILYNSKQFFSGLIETAFQKHFYQINCQNSTQNLQEIKSESKQIISQ